MGRPPVKTVFFSIIAFLLCALTANAIVFFILGKLLNIISITRTNTAVIAAVIIVSTIEYAYENIIGIKKTKDKLQNSPIEADMVGQDIYGEYIKRADRHIEKIHKALARADYAHSPFISPYVDEYGIVWFNVSVAWDKLSEVKKRIREGLPDTTIEQRLDVE